jgi:hypothetical protein
VVIAPQRTQEHKEQQHWCRAYACTPKKPPRVARAIINILTRQQPPIRASNQYKITSLMLSRPVRTPKGDAKSHHCITFAAHLIFCNPSLPNQSLSPSPLPDQSKTSTHDAADHTALERKLGSERHCAEVLWLKCLMLLLLIREKS